MVKVKILRNYSRVIVIDKYLCYKIIENLLSDAKLITLNVCNGKNQLAILCSILASDRDDGLVESVNKEKLAIAKIMLQGKESLDKIMRYTGLSKKELTMYYNNYLN